MSRVACAALVVALWAAPFVGAAESKLGLIVGQTKEGVVVASVNGGSAADFMGLRADDKIVQFKYTPAGGKEGGVVMNPTLDAAKPLLDGRLGRYELMVLPKGKDKPVPINGQLVERVEKDRKVLVFVRDRERP